MANAFLLKPLSLGTPVQTNPSNAAIGWQVGNDYAGLVWSPGSSLYFTGSATLHIDLGSDQALDTVMLFGVVLDGSCTVEVRTATDAQGAFAGAYSTLAGQALFAGSQMPVSGKGVSILAAPAPTARYVRLMFAVSGTITVARAVIGKKIALNRNFTFGAQTGVRDLGSLDFSRRGVLLRNRGAKLRTVSLSFSNAYKDEVESYIKPLLEQIGNTEMIALCTDPAADAQRQNRCYYGPLVGDLGMTWRNAAAWEWKANLVSIF